MSEEQKWWRGDTRADFENFIKDQWSDATQQTVFPECEGCGCLVYRVRLGASGATRACVACGAAAGICGTPVADKSVDAVKCQCGKDQFEIAVSFAATTPAKVGVSRRCLSCARLDVIRDWTTEAGAEVLEGA